VSKQVVIVGAGPGGLASAMLLAGAVAKVTVLERLPQVGGRTSVFEREGFRFDLGPTFFLYPLALERIFAAVGRDLHREVELVQLDPQYSLVFGAGGRLRCTHDLPRMERELAALDPEDSRSLRRFLDDNRTRLQDFRPILESPFNGWRDLLRWPVLRLLPQLRPWLSLDGELRRYFRDPRVRLAFSFQSKYLGMSPFQCPGLFSILSFLEYEHGVHHPVGGCGALSEAMARVARSLGVDIHLGEEVRQVLFRGQRAVGVRTARGAYKADALVINADFAHAMRRLVPDELRRRWTDARIATRRFSCSTFMMYLGMEGRFDHLDHHTIYLSADYVRNLEDITNRHVLSEDPSFYVQNACVSDPGLAPPGCSTLYVLAPVTHQHPNVCWEQERARFRALLLKQLEKVGIEDAGRRIRCERIVTPADWEHGYAIHRGATFNLAHTLGQMLHLRPHNRFEDLESVYLVGGGTHPGSGLPVIFESARITARLLREDLGLRGAGDPAPETITPAAVRPILAATGG
jgi:phytoene desaturase